MRLRGRGDGGATVTLVESVRQNRARGLTIFDEAFVARRGRRVTRRAFSLTFRTRPLAEIAGRLAEAGFRVEAVLGDYQGRAWDPRADVWLLLARRR